MTVSGRPLVTGPARFPVRLSALLLKAGSIRIEETFPPYCVSSCATPDLPTPYCGRAVPEGVCSPLHQLLTSSCSSPTGSNRRDVHMLFPEEEKIIVEEIRSNGQTVMEERSSRAFHSHTLNETNN